MLGLFDACAVLSIHVATVNKNIWCVCVWVGVCVCVGVGVGVWVCVGVGVGVGVGVLCVVGLFDACVILGIRNNEQEYKIF